jgi:thiol-disulfide isomerase/thioredoxin
MKKLLFILLIGGSLCGNLQAQTKKATPVAPKTNAYELSIQMKPYQNAKIYLGTNYGKNRVLADSCLLNAQSEGVFKGDKKLTPGIYFIVSPKYSILFDFILDDAQHFKIIADSNDLANFKIIGSKENDIFKDYIKQINVLGSELASIDNNYKAAKTKEDSATYRTKYIEKDKEVKNKRKYFSTTYPNSMTSYFLNVMQRPEAPTIPIVKGKADSTYPFFYVKNHFWDNVVFNDNRLLRTPFFEDKLDEYFKNYVSREPDSIIQEVQYMLSIAKTGKEIYPFLLFKFTNKYISPEFMGQDKVFLHLFQNFFAKGDTVLLNAESKKAITERAYSIMANQLGLMAPPMNFNTVDDQPFSLYGLKGPYTFVAFWDPTCSHCKVEIPQLDSFYRANWKKWDVQVVAVNINFKELTSWKSFIKEKHLDGWNHIYQTEADLNKEIKEGRATTIRQLYDVYKTPTFYLLDANKRIVAKNLGLQQFHDFLQNAMNKKGAN